MARINEHGYIERGTKSTWWLGKEFIQLGTLYVPKKYHGKRLRFKVEVVNEYKEKEESGGEE